MKKLSLVSALAIALLGVVAFTPKVSADEEFEKSPFRHILNYQSTHTNETTNRGQLARNLTAYRHQIMLLDLGFLQNHIASNARDYGEALGNVAKSSYSNDNTGMMLQLLGKKMSGKTANEQRIIISTVRDKLSRPTSSGLLDEFGISLAEIVRALDQVLEVKIADSERITVVNTEVQQDLGTFINTLVEDMPAPTSASLPAETGAARTLSDVVNASTATATNTTPTTTTTTRTTIPASTATSSTTTTTTSGDDLASMSEMDILTNLFNELLQ